MNTSLLRHTKQLAITLAFACLGCGNHLVGTGDEGGDDPPQEGCGDTRLAPGEFCHVLDDASLPSRTFQAGDFNADGNLDVGSVTTANGVPSFEYWSGDGTGKFSVAPTVVETPGSGLFRVAAELDGAAGTDFLVVNNSTEEIFSYLNAGGEFQAPIISLAGIGMTPWNSVTLIDAEGDGRADLLIEPSSGSGPLRVLLNTDGVFEASPITVDIEPGCTHQGTALIPRFSQFFSGGFAFLASLCAGEGPLNNPITVLLTRDNGQFVEPQYLGAGTFPTEAVAGDFDADGKPGLLVWDRDSQTFHAYASGFTGTYEDSGEIHLNDLCPGCGASGAVATTGLAVGDFDGVEGVDLLVQRGATIFVTEMVQRASQTTHAISVAQGKVLIADFNSDGVDDIVVSNNSEFAHVLISNP